MRYFILTLLFSSLAWSMPAEARKVRLPIPIPSFSKSETLVKVQDLPKQAPFIDREGNQIDLGYYWSASGEGQWVGYISSTRYLKWTPEMVDLVLQFSGMKSLPPIPERTADLSGVGGWSGVFWFGIIVLAGIGWLVKRRNNNHGPAADTVAAASRAESAAPAESNLTSRAEAQIRSVANATNASPQTAGRQAPPLSRAPRLSSTSGMSRASFGRR